MRKPDPKIKFTFNEWCVSIISKAPKITTSTWPYAGPPTLWERGFKTTVVLYWWMIYLRFYRA